LIFYKKKYDKYGKVMKNAMTWLKSLISAALKSINIKHLKDKIFCWKTEQVPTGSTTGERAAATPHWDVG